MIKINAKWINFYLNRFPFYYWIKIIILLWIVSPSGSTYLYKRFIQPLLKEREQVDWLFDILWFTPLCFFFSFKEIDQLIEDTKNRSYSALIDLTNKGLRYASNAFLNTAVLVNEIFIRKVNVYQLDIIRVKVILVNI